MSCFVYLEQIRGITQIQGHTRENLPSSVEETTSNAKASTSHVTANGLGLAVKCIFSRYGMHAVVFRVFGIHSERYA